eukprot:SAG31_NODE_22102_length_533_cov_13.566820_1_plen_43_part_01
MAAVIPYNVQQYPSRPQVVSSEIMQWLSGSSKWDETIQHDEVI